MRKKPIVIVDWEDTTSHHSWEKEKDADFTISMCHSIGWRLKSSSRYILLAQQMDETGYFTDRVKIPKGCIESIRKLNER